MARQPNLESEQSSKSSSKTQLRTFSFLTLFPEVLRPFLESSLMGRAQKSGLAHYDFIQIRDFAEDIHRSVDGAPYGGGAGMVLRADVLRRAWLSAVQETALSERLTVLLSPQGSRFTQTTAKDWLRYKKIVLVCGHYEGVDERFIDSCVDQEVSIGDFVVTGGELPALMLVDSMVRLIPGVVGNAESVREETFEGGLLKYPQYTRPAEFEGRKVPDLLLSGNHGRIKEWRQEERILRTRRKRPDLMSEV